jgi:hypothetical protein
MNYHLVHTGKGNVRKVDLPDDPDLTLDTPRTAQKLADVAKFLSRRETFLKRADAIESAHTNYKPGRLIELGEDQCRAVVVDENYTMCGAKIHKGSYCEHHHKISVRG